MPKDIYQLLTRIPVPGFSRVYCADPAIGFLGFSLNQLRKSGLFNGVQIIIPRHRIKNKLRQLNTKEADQVLKATPSESLEKIIIYSLAIQAEVQLDKLTEGEVCSSEIKEHYKKLAAMTLHIYRQELKHLRPHCILLAQGYGIEACALRLLALELNIPILALENTALKDKMLWEPISGVTVNRNLAKNFFWKYEAGTPADVAVQYCHNIITETKKLKSEEHSSPSQEWVKNKDRPLVLFLGQVYTDSSILYGSRYGLYQESLLMFLAQWCRERNFQLFIKLHPKEKTGISPVTGVPYNQLTLRKLQALPEYKEVFEKNTCVIIDADNSWDTYSLIDKSDLVVTINSQAGLEAAIRGRKVVTCGDSFYAGLGFTYDVTHQSQLGITLDSAWEESFSVENQIRAKKFFYIFFEKYCFEKTEKKIHKLLRRAPKWQMPQSC